MQFLNSVPELRTTPKVFYGDLEYMLTNDIFMSHCPFLHDYICLLDDDDDVPITSMVYKTCHIQCDHYRYIRFTARFKSTYELISYEFPFHVLFILTKLVASFRNIQTHVIEPIFTNTSELSSWIQEMITSFSTDKLATLHSVPYAFIPSVITTHVYSRPLHHPVNDAYSTAAIHTTKFILNLLASTPFRPGIFTPQCITSLKLICYHIIHPHRSHRAFVDVTIIGKIDLLSILSSQPSAPSVENSETTQVSALPNEIQALLLHNLISSAYENSSFFEEYLDPEEQSKPFMRPFIASTNSEQPAHSKTSLEILFHLRLPATLSPFHDDKTDIVAQDQMPPVLPLIQGTRTMDFPFSIRSSSPPTMNHRRRYSNSCHNDIYASFEKL